jgi:hypothetical protein
VFVLLALQFLRHLITHILQQHLHLLIGYCLVVTKYVGIRHTNISHHIFIEAYIESVAEFWSSVVKGSLPAPRVCPKYVLGCSEGELGLA